MQTYLRLMNYIRPYLFRIVLAIFCTMAAAAGNLYVPWIIKDVIDKVLANRDMAMLNYISGGIIVVFFFRGLFFYGQTYLMSYVGQKIIIDIRAAVYRHMQKLSLSYYERNRTGALMSFITNDVAALQGALVDSMIELVTEGVTLIVSIGTMVYIHWKLSFLTFITFPLVGYTINHFGRKLRSTSHVVQDKAADINAVLQESIAGVRVIKSFVREDYEIERFGHVNETNFRAQMKNSQLMASLTPTIEFLAAIGVTAIIWYGGHEVIEGKITAGALIAFLIYAVNISNPLKRLSRVYGNIQRAMAAAQRVFSILDTEPEIADAPGATELPAIAGKVEFHQVSFEYTSGQLALRNLNITAEPGEMVAIVGPSGAGKTTVANLIPRFYDPTEGHISIDGFPLQSVTIESLRRQIGIVPQETLLFNGTVLENIRYGRLEATKEEVIAAAQAANAHAFIEQMPQGYETEIGERGTKLSGGQRQRIAIARAILKNPRVLILDEATSALDTESESLVQQALDRLMTGRTSFVIAHRLSTIQRADKIVVMERGQVVEQGSHEELLQTGGLYSKLYQVQFGQMETV